MCPMIILALACCEDCCDGQGQLHHICCGEFGTDMVVQYLPALDINALDLVAIKLDWLEAELEILSKTLTKAVCTQEWSDKAELSIHWVYIQLFEVLNIFGIFCVYKLFINCLCGFIYCLCLFTTFL
jgi:hypothetical protein